MTFRSALPLTRFVRCLRGWARLRVTAALLGVVIWLCLVPERALSQQQSSSGFPETAAPLSSDEIISQLRHDQVLVMRAKQAIIHKREEKGQLTYEENLTDEELFQLVRDDREVRALVQSLLSGLDESLKSAPAEVHTPEPLEGQRLKPLSPPAADVSQPAEDAGGHLGYIRANLDLSLQKTNQFLLL